MKMFKSNWLVVIIGLGVLAFITAFALTLQSPVQSPVSDTTSSTSPTPIESLEPAITRPERNLFSESSSCDSADTKLYDNFSDALSAEGPVCYLALSGLSEVPPLITSLTELRELRLNASSFTELPAGMGNLQNLVVLQLRGNNNLASLPLSLDQITSMRMLDVRDSSISDFPPGFRPMLNMRMLHVSENQFRDTAQLQFLFPNARVSTSPPE